MVFGAAPVQSHNPNKDVEVSDPPSDGISDLHFSPVSNHLCATSWDNKVRVWEVSSNGQAVPKAMTEHAAPVLAASWFHDGSKVFSASCDKSVKMWDLNTNKADQVAAHDAPVKTVHWIKDANVLMTTSWDRSIRYWDTRTPSPAASVQLPERAYCADVMYPLAVVATAERHVLVYDLRSPGKVFKQIESPLKYQSRCVACFPAKNGFALGSIEGRVAIQYVDQENKAKNFSFKCHRDDKEIYSVNSIKFHPQYGTFATCGADGGFNFWDKDSKQRLKNFQRANAPIACCAFNGNGSIFAYAVSYDWSKGHQYYNPSQPNQNHILLHATTDVEVKQRAPSHSR